MQHCRAGRTLAVRGLSPRAFAWLGLTITATMVTVGCRINEHIADPPVDAIALTTVIDARPDPADPDAAIGDDPDAAAECEPGANGDGDQADDCAEAGDADPFTDPAVFNGLNAVIGDLPDWTGSCDALDDYAEMVGHFDTPVQAQNVYAGWDFNTDKDDYRDASFGFQPPWSTSASGRFSVRFVGRIALTAGPHCFSIDIGATGTDIVNGKNACGQVYVGVGAAPTAALAETGFSAATSGVATACVDVATAGPAELDIVFWYFNIFEQAKLVVRHCAGAACTPGEPITPAMVQAGL